MDFYNYYPANAIQDNNSRFYTRSNSSLGQRLSRFEERSRQNRILDFESVVRFPHFQQNDEICEKIVKKMMHPRKLNEEMTIFEDCC